MSQFTDYYFILGINHNATSNDIYTAYKKLSLKWHPDRNRGADATKKMQEINEAKRILSDKELREIYNEKYRAYKKDAASQHKDNAENKKVKAKYVCNLKTDDELIRTCANAAKYNFEYIHAVLQELKKRSYTLDTINRIIKQKGKPYA